MYVTQKTLLNKEPNNIWSLKKIINTLIWTRYKENCWKKDIIKLHHEIINQWFCFMKRKRPLRVRGKLLSYLSGVRNGAVEASRFRFDKSVSSAKAR